jgi:uncharacterized membrane protein required for colicin V production
MFWDGLIVFVGICFVLLGWNKGIMREWTGFIALIITTLVTKLVYIDFSAWLVSRLWISPTAAVLIGYVVLWFFIDALVELLMALLIAGPKEHQPNLLDRLGGLGYGLIKTLIVVLLPIMAVNTPIKIPPAPPDRSGLALPNLTEDSSSSILLPKFTVLANNLSSKFGQYLISDQAPRFKVEFTSPTSSNN